MNKTFPGGGRNYLEFGEGIASFLLIIIIIRVVIVLNTKKRIRFVSTGYEKSWF